MLQILQISSHNYKFKLINTSQLKVEDESEIVLMAMFQPALIHHC